MRVTLIPVEITGEAVRIGRKSGVGKEQLRSAGNVIGKVRDAPIDALLCNRDRSVNLLKKQREHRVKISGNSGTGQPTLTPYFTVKDADRLIDFLVRACGATLTKEDRYDDGLVQHARLLIGNSTIMLNEASDEYPANISQMHIRVESADIAFQSALRLGANSLMVPNDRPHGDRMAGITDPCDNIWWLASPLT